MSFLLSVAATMLLNQVPSPAAERLMMQPTIHGDTVVFSYAGDLWSANLDGGDAKRLTSGAGGKAYPNISPDGKTLAFSAEYDGSPAVYTIPVDGGVPKRLTYEAGADLVIGWTPGNRIAYATGATSPYLGRQMELFTVSPDGGIPEPTPIKEIFWGSYFPDGHTIAYTRRPSFLFNWRRYRGGTQGVVSIFDMATDKYSELPHGREQQYYPMVVGDDIYFVSDKNDGILNLYRYNLQSKTSKKLTDFKVEDIKYARTDGKRIVFTQDGYTWIYNIATGDCHTFSPPIHADELLSRDHVVDASRYIDSATISPSGARVAVTGRGRLFSLPVHSGLTRNLSGPEVTSREDHPQWSSDGQAIAFISDASGETELYTRPQMGGKAVQVSDLHKTIVQYSWSPDNKTFGVMTIDNGLYLVDAATKKATLVIQSKYGLGGFDFSPDSNWVAFTDSKVTNTSVLKLYNISTKQIIDVTSGAYQDADVVFDLSGKYLYLVSARTFSPMPGLFGPNLKIENAQRVYLLTLAKDETDPLLPKDDEEPLKEGATAKPPAAAQHPTGAPTAKPGGPPPTPSMKIDLDGLGSRIIPLPLPPGDYHLLAGAENGVFFQTGGEIMKYDLTGKHTEPVIKGPVISVDFNPSRSMMAYVAPLGLVGVVPVGAPSVIGAGRVDTTNVEFNLDVRAEWKQIYWEAWRFIRDHYYDANFRGMNWKAIGDHYASWLPYCASRNDLNTLLNFLLSELGTSHAYLEGRGDVGASLVRPVPVGCLGADYVVDHGAVKFAKIYRGDSDDESDTGPLGLPGIDVHEGDYLLAIDGVDVTANTNPDALLLNKVGKVVDLTVNSTPSKAGARQVEVRPAGSEVMLRYLDFIHKCRQTVDKLSNGRIGYMHIRDTAAPGSEDFARNFNALTDKDALIVDERWNGGGYPDPQFIEALARKNYAWGQDRNGGDAPITPSIYGPMAMLINSYAGSGGDLFPWTFKRAGLGVLIGSRTWGGLVGIGQGADLVDGGSISTPSFSIYDQRTNEIIAENHGIDPDIDVDYRPDLVAKGEDPQLEAAVKYLMDKLAKMPARPVRTTLPKVDKLGHVDQ